MDGEESEDDEDEIRLPHQETQSHDALSAISVLSYNSRTTSSTFHRIQYEEQNPIHLARAYPVQELGNCEQRQSHTSGGFHSIDWDSLQEDAASLPSMPISELPTNGRYATESSPKGSPGAKWEECVPNSALTSTSMARRDRVYTVEDIKNLHRIDGRLDTFKIFKWNNPFMDKRVLATAGFFYKGEEDEVVCVGCGNSLRGWCKGDDPWDEHKDKFNSVCFSRRQ